MPHPEAHDSLTPAEGRGAPPAAGHPTHSAPSESASAGEALQPTLTDLVASLESDAAPRDEDYFRERFHALAAPFTSAALRFRAMFSLRKSRSQCTHMIVRI